MGILDTVAPRKGPKQRRLTLTFIFKAASSLVVVGFVVFVVLSVFLWENDRSIAKIPATSNETVVLKQVQDYLKSATHRGLSKQDEPSGCWDVFSDKEFTVAYLDQGMWRIDAFYERIRYFWWVDDLSLEVSQDNWVKSRKDVLKRIYTSTIDC